MGRMIFAYVGFGLSAATAPTDRCQLMELSQSASMTQARMQWGVRQLRWECTGELEMAQYKVSRHIEYYLEEGTQNRKPHSVLTWELLSTNIDDTY